MSLETEGLRFSITPLDFYDERAGRQMRYVYPGDTNQYAGWILWKHPDGQWVTYRKATPSDIEKLKDAVVKEHHATGD